MKVKVRNIKRLRHLFLLLFLLIMALLFSNCSPQKRLNRMIRKHPELVQKDTIRFTDTTIIPEVRIDTAFHYESLKDTVFITKEKLTVRIHQLRDTIYIEAHQEQDTVVITREIPVERIIHSKTESWIKKIWKDFKYKVVLSVLLLIILIGFGIKIVKGE
ncbi:MAG: hypothetical protein ABIJ97_11430 [Bacteroidota bacterium]